MFKISVLLLVFSKLCFCQEYESDQHTLGLWHFNENFGATVTDFSGNNAHGNLNGNPEWVEGILGNGILLDGIDDYISFQNDTLFNYNKGDSFSIEFWIKIISNDGTNNKILFSKCQDVIYSYGYGFIIWIDQNNKLNARLTDDVLIGQPLAGPVLEHNKWYNIVFIRDFPSSKMSFFVNGKKTAEILDPTYDLKNNIPFYMGRTGRDEGWENTCINAIIDEIRISDTARAMTNTEEMYDLFPLGRWNKYFFNYQYSDTTYYVGTLEYIVNYSGKIEFQIIDSTLIGNSTEWLVKQTIKLNRYYETLQSSDSSLVENSYNFILTENLNGNRELRANPPTWDSIGQWGNIGIWQFPVQETPVYRFNEKNSFIMSTTNPAFLDSLWFDETGLYKRTFYTEYIGNHQVYTHTLIELENMTVHVESKNKNKSKTEGFSLFQNYPNPFNPNTTIEYSIPEQTNVTLKVFDLLGREISILVNEQKPAGNYKVEFMAFSIPSGIYFYRLEAGEFIETKKFILLK